MNFSRTPSKSLFSKSATVPAELSTSHAGWFAPRDQKDYSALTKSAFRYIPGFMRSYRNFIAITSDSRFVVWMLQFSTLRHYVEEVSRSVFCYSLSLAESLHPLQWSAAYIRSQSPPKYHKFLVPSESEHM